MPWGDGELNCSAEQTENLEFSGPIEKEDSEAETEKQRNWLMKEDYKSVSFT